MARYTVNTDEVKVTKQVLGRLGELKLEAKNIKGVVKIVGYRKYVYRNEVDIEFTGTVYAQRRSVPEWLPTELLKSTTFSKIKVNRLVRKYLFPELRCHLRYLGVELKYLTDIKKLKLI